MKPIKCLAIAVILLSACAPAKQTTLPVPFQTLTPIATSTQSPSQTYSPTPTQAAIPTSTTASTPTQTASEYCEQLLDSYHPADGYQTYCDVDYGFAFDYPISWRKVMVSKAPGFSLPSTPRKAMLFYTEDMSNFIYTNTYNLDDGRMLQERVEYSLGYNDRAFPDKSYSSLVLGGHSAYAMLECSAQLTTP